MEIKLVSPQPKHALTHDSHFQMSHKSKSQTRSPPSGPCSSLPHTAGKTVALPEKKKITESTAKKALLKPGPASSCYYDLEEVRRLSLQTSVLCSKTKTKKPSSQTDRCSSYTLHTDLGPWGEWRLCSSPGLYP